jgi:DNA-binding beta-propeller fold protein YncE
VRCEMTSIRVAGLVALLVLGGCAQGGAPDVPTIERTRAEASPPPAAPAAGEVLDVGASVRALVFDEGTATLVALAEPGDRVLLLPRPGPGNPAPAGVAAGLVEVALPGTATAIAPGAAGSVLLAAGTQVLRLDIAARSIAEVPMAQGGDQLRSVAEQADGSVLAGTDTGRVISSDGSLGVTGMVSVDALAVTPAGVAALDQRQTLLSEVDQRGRRFGLSLRAGTGATNVATDGVGRVLVANTAGGELLAYTLDPLMLRQRYPVPGSPYGVAHDGGNDLVWVTQTGRNEVASYALASGIPVETGRYPTVRQPDSVAVDEEGGLVYVASATGDGIQRLPAR